MFIIVTMQQRAEKDIGTSCMLSCPSCGGHDVRRSHSRGLFDSFMSKFRKLPFRCRACTRRFYQYVPAEGDEVEVDRDTETTPTESPHRTNSQR